MQGEQEKVRDTTEGSGQQQQVTSSDEEPNPVGQDSAKSEYGEIGDETPSGSEPRRSMGTHGTEFGQFGERGSPGQQGQSGTGQADLGSQAGSTLSGRADQQELGQTGGEVDQPASYGEGNGSRRSNTEGEGFILQQGSGPTSASSARATEGTDFAPQGRGANEDEDEESETGARDVGSGGPGSSA